MGAGLPVVDDVAVWVDGPGVCPVGVKQVDITTLAGLEDATRGEGANASDAANTCYLIHNGTYTQSGSTLPVYIEKGGSSSTARRLFVGQSRTGVVIRGRGTVADGVSHVRITNLTFDLTGYSQSGSFNTLTLLTGTDQVVDHVTFTGDCATGSTGAAFEVDGTTNVLLESSIVEKFGHCGADGHLDHGVYLGNGDGIVIRNNDIRFNSSRGIQLNTEQGEFGTLNNVTIEQNRIHGNGHADYEDGIVLNGDGTGTISNVTIRRNLIYGNYYAGLRTVAAAYVNVVVTDNTFFHNGVEAAGGGKSEINLDDTGSGANTTITRNIIAAESRGLNDCYDAFARKYVVVDNVVDGAMPTGSAGNCVSQSVAAAPLFVNAASADFHLLGVSVSGYGAYAP